MLSIREIGKCYYLHYKKIFRTEYGQIFQYIVVSKLICCLAMIIFLYILSVELSKLWLSSLHVFTFINIKSSFCWRGYKKSLSNHLIQYMLALQPELCIAKIQFAALVTTV